MKQLLAANSLDEAIFAYSEDAEIPPVDPYDYDGEESPLANMMSLLGGDGFGADHIAVWEHTSGG